MDDLLADFLTETNEGLASLDVALVKLERTPDDRDTLSLIFRLVHTIKGTCGFLGLPRLERVAHAGENVLGRVRDGALRLTPDHITLVLAGLDSIKAILAGLAATGAEPAGDDSALIAELNAVADGGPPTNPARAPVGDTLVTNSSDPALPDMSATATIGPQAASPELVPGEIAPAETATGEAVTTVQTIRVSVDVLEGLMTLVSELVLTRNQLLQLARMQDNSEFDVPLQRLSHITSDLQEGVMKTRMQPIGNAWNKLPRLVRDLGRDLDKRIELILHGAETELDRQVLELIKDPLTHMVRNSGDHGLETPAERRAAGKPETGHITLNAYHEGGHILIEIADDGRGLPVERIRYKVLANGLATEAELSGMTDAEIQRFIFRAGFSTATTVTAVSGRGVGMDVVKTNIEQIGGSIDLKSTPGEGTAFTIKIPLTLAIVSALIVEASGERFAIPQISVVELVRASHPSGQGTGGRMARPEGGSVIERVNGTPVLRLRDSLLPLVGLNDLLRLGATGTAENSADQAYIVVTQVGANLLGIIVDRVFDTEEIVVKPVAPILRHITMFSGNTILGDGSVIMILDPNGIARATGLGAGGAHRHAAAPVPEAGRATNKTAMLLFHAGGTQPMAVPLGLVARLEAIEQDKIENSLGAIVTQYRGSLMKLIPLSGERREDLARQPVLVFTDRGRSMGLMVDEIIDVVDEALNIELSGSRPGLLGTAVIAGRATDVIDTGYWLTQASQDWFDSAEDVQTTDKPRLLVVEDSDFFRQMLVPSLAAQGFRVTAVRDAAEALALRDSGAMFEAIISDIEMPGMDGCSFARAVRGGGSWALLPMIALSSRADPGDIAAGRDAGFTDYVAKHQREALLTSLRDCLAEPIEASS